MNEKELLQKIGLTESETKVYLALLKIGDFTSKGKILKEAKIAPSKVYHILNKLLDKGLVSTIIKNNVKHFAAAPPSRIQDYLLTKKQEIVEQEKTANSLLPKLEETYKSFQKESTAEIFKGWQGMETVYFTVINSCKSGETAYVLGASQGSDPEKTTKFFKKHGLKTLQKGIKVKIIYNENSRDYVKLLEKESGMKFNKKFLNFLKSKIWLG